MRTLVHFASWWSSLTAAIFTRKSCTIRKCRQNSTSVRYGTAWCRWQEVWKPCMTGTSCTEIWSLQMSSCRLTALLNLGTWMFRKLRKMMDYCSPRLVLPTMRAQRCGRISPTITKVTSGRLDACSTKWQHLWLPNSFKPILKFENYSIGWLTQLWNYSMKSLSELFLRCNNSLHCYKKY